MTTQQTTGVWIFEVTNTDLHQSTKHTTHYNIDDNHATDATLC